MTRERALTLWPKEIVDKTIERIMMEMPCLKDHYNPKYTEEDILDMELEMKLLIL
ncbi:MAG: hypothetical protein Q4F74_03840 [Synergistaceae bacterium]|nr:hypothetical protein [Synergistaceae bacterium]